MRLGIHVSIAGNIHEAAQRAKDLKCDCMQIFSRNPRRWKPAKLKEKDIELFKKKRKKFTIKPLAVHASYLINLASPDNKLYNKSITAFAEDVKRADKLQADFFITHLGSHKGKGKDFGIRRFAKALDRIIAESNPKTTILLENTAGSGNEIGSNFEEIAEIINSSNYGKKLGLCLDTCHAYAAGYNIAMKEGLQDALSKIDTLIGLEKLKLIHLNDSKGKLASHIDRHYHIGKGHIGKRGFYLILHHPKLRNLSYILETPKDDPKSDSMNLKMARSIYERHISS
jgi:deoxyribonuclease-4